MNIPNDPIMLLSFINTQLRDNYSSLTELVKSADANEKEIVEKLRTAGYRYDREKNQFIAKTLFSRDVKDEEGNKIYSIDYSNGFEELADFLASYNPEKQKKVCIVSDSHVASIYLDTVTKLCENHFSKVTSFVFPEGEASKNLDTVRDIYVKLIEEKFTRKDVLLALGGGVTGDMCGYTAATFLRGIDFIQVPTSLLADVDSSIGGKTGVDFDSYKNMVGAFHMPVNVYINVATLDTLSRRQLYSGMGEVVKMALIRGDDGFYSWLEENISKVNESPLDRNFISKVLDFSNQKKADIVAEDPHEMKGVRELLNFGHTLGHAIEKFMNFELLHGECVLIGCILGCIISRNKGMIGQDLVDSAATLILDNMEVPRIGDKINDTSIPKVIEYTHSDKKAVGAYIKYVLLEGVGKAVIRTDVNDEDMKAALEEYLEKYDSRA